MLKPLKNRRLLLGLAVLAALLLTRLTYWRVVGHSRGESFFRGRPTSYWRQEILDYHVAWSRYKTCWVPTTPTDRLRASFGLDDRLGHEAPLLSEGDPAAVAVLLELRRDEECTARSDALVGLGKIGDRDPRVVPALRAALSDAEPAVRTMAALLLGDIGPPARPAVPELVRALHDGDQEMRELGARALWDIDPPAAQGAGLPEHLRLPHELTP